MNSQSLQIYLSSQYASQKLNSSYNSDVLFYFKSPIVPPLGYNMTIKVLNASIPVSFTLVDSSNNSLIINSTTYVLTSGNYNATTMVTMLQSILPNYFTISYNTTTGKFTFVSTNAQFTVSSSSTCLTLLGFSGSTTSSSTVGAYTLSSTYVCDLSGNNMLYLDLANLHTTNLSSISGTRTSIVKSIINNVSYGSVLFVQDTGTAPIFIQEDHLGFAHVRILGEDESTLINFNNADWQITLEVGFAPKQVQPTLALPFEDIYQSYIKKLNA